MNRFSFRPFMWKRSIDDIFLVWTHGRQLLLDFIAYLNSLHPTIKFTSNIDSNSVDFLDVTVFKGTRFQQHRTLDTRTFFKSTNSFHYLAFDSFHPFSTKKGIVIGEATRFLRNCSSATAFNEDLLNLKRHFLNRGYGEHFIDDCLMNVTFTDRHRVS